MLCDLSKNGTRIDGARREKMVLEPGIEIGIGGLTLIAESRSSVELRGFLARILGWRSNRIEVVDHALRSIRLAASRRVELVLRGDGDLVPIARSIHRIRCIDPTLKAPGNGWIMQRCRSLAPRTAGPEHPSTRTPEQPSTRRPPAGT
jgi:hypothetical protein